MSGLGEALQVADKLLPEAQLLIALAIALGIVFQVLLPVFASELRGAWIVVLISIVLGVGFSQASSFLSNSLFLDGSAIRWLLLSVVVSFATVELVTRYFRIRLQRGTLCPRCGETSAGAARFCGACGAVLDGHSVERFVMSSTTGTIHRASCPVAKRVRSDCRVSFSTLAEARRTSNARPCGVCLPYEEGDFVSPSPSSALPRG